MKRQVAILGDTPEFLRWSVRHECVLREETQLDSIDETEKRLRAVRALGLAVGQQRVHDGIAIQKFDDQWKGFRVDEVTSFWNGLSIIEGACLNCPANLLNTADIHGAFAGCHGWLPRILKEENSSKTMDLGEAIEQLLGANDRQSFEKQFLATSPAWYGIWSDGSLAGKTLGWVELQFRELAEQQCSFHPLVDFAKVLKQCVERQLTLDVELVPHGFSDGLNWRIGVHCDRCKSPFEEGQRYCRCCKKPGQGHPMRKRRVLGLRPYVDLQVLLGTKTESFLQKWTS